MHCCVSAGRQLCKSQAFFEDVPDIPHVSFSDEQEDKYIVRIHHLFDHVLINVTHSFAIVLLDSIQHICHGRHCMQEVCGRRVSLEEGGVGDHT